MLQTVDCYRSITTKLHVDVGRTLFIFCVNTILKRAVGVYSLLTCDFSKTTLASSYLMRSKIVTTGHHDFKL